MYHNTKKDKYKKKKSKTYGLGMDSYGKSKKSSKPRDKKTFEDFKGYNHERDK